MNSILEEHIFACFWCSFYKWISLIHRKNLSHIHKANFKEFLEQVEKTGFQWDLETG